MNNGFFFEGQKCRRCSSFVFKGNAYCPFCGEKMQKKRSPIVTVALTLLQCLCFYLVFTCVETAVKYVYYMIVSSATGYFSAQNGTDFDTNAFSALYMKYIHEVSILSGFLVIMVFSFIFTARGQSFAREISLKRISLKSAGAMAVYGFSSQLIIGIGLSVLYFLIPSLSSYSNSDSVNALFATGSVVSQFLNVAVMTGIVEEIVFRGLIYKTLKTILPTPLAVIASAAVFGAAHMNLEQFFYTSLLGVLLALVYDRCNSIVAPIIVHVAFNGSNFILAYLNFQSPYAYIAMFICAIGACLITTALLFFTKRVPIKGSNTIKD